MEGKRENPLAAQSKQWMLEALLQLMNKKDYSGITIKELCIKAGVDRKTFYRHFKSKDEILELPVREACDRYISELKKLPELNSFEITESYFHICAEYADFFGLLDRHGLLPLLLKKFDEYLPRLNELFSADPLYRKKSPYELIYQAGGFWNVTVQWIRNGQREKPGRMAGIISSIMPASLTT